MKGYTYAALASLLALTSVGPVYAQPRETQFDLTPNPKTIACLSDSSGEAPTAHVKLVRGELNDSLKLEVHHFKPGLAFDLFTVEHSPFLADGTPDPTFTGSFGLAWYQSDVQVDNDRVDADGRVKIRTILLDQIFGFDPDVGLRRRIPFMSASGSMIPTMRHHADSMSLSRRPLMVSTRPDPLPS